MKYEIQLQQVVRIYHDSSLTCQQLAQSKNH